MERYFAVAEFAYAMTDEEISAWFDRLCPGLTCLGIIYFVWWVFFKKRSWKIRWVKCQGCAGSGWSRIDTSRDGTSLRCGACRGSGRIKIREPKAPRR